MALLEAKPALITTASVFEMGNLSTKCLIVDTSNSCSPPPPKPLLIVTPTQEGTYPVLLFLHGFCVRCSFYTQLLQHISSHGFIVVSPQLYSPFMPSTGREEVNSAAAITNWLSEGLQYLLPKNVEANLLKLALSGHSRGGKAAFSLALGHAKTSLKFSVLLGVDPVAGPSKCYQISPKILTYKPCSFELSIPITVIGTGLGDEFKNCMPLACAPDGMNHEEFFIECKSCWYFVTKDYGHMDMLDDELPGCIGGLAGCMCKSGKGAKDPMRRTVGGIVVATLKDYLEGGGGTGYLKAIVDEPDVAPVKLDPAEFKHDIIS